MRILLALVVLLGSLPAFAQTRLPPETWIAKPQDGYPYFAVRVQRRWLTLERRGNLPSTTETTPENYLPVNYRYDASHKYHVGNGISTAIGWDWRKYRLRTEVQFGYQYASGRLCFRTDFDGAGTDKVYAKFYCRDLHDHLYEILGNAYYDMSLKNIASGKWADIEPYIGVGLGYSIYNGPVAVEKGASVKQISALTHGTDDRTLTSRLEIGRSGFIYALHFGASYKVWELGYRFLGTDKENEVFGGHALVLGFRF